MSAVLQRPLRVAGVVSRELDDGEVALLGADKEQMIVLNSVGSVVWELCDGKRSPQAIAAFIAEHTKGAGDAQVSEDVEALLRTLVNAHFLVEGAA